MVVFGTRPEAIKMAPLVIELKKQADLFETTTVMTAQHRQMLDQVPETFKIKPDYDLDIMGKNQNPQPDITVRILHKLDDILKENKARYCALVHGDTTTTFAAGSCSSSIIKFVISHVKLGCELGINTLLSQKR